jgi:hypothetical protein
MPVTPSSRPAPIRLEAAPRSSGLRTMLEQQYREQEVVHQALHLLPHRAVERGVAAQQEAAEDEREIGEQQLGVVHRPRIADELFDPG